MVGFLFGIWKCDFSSEETEDTQYRLDMEKLYREEYMIVDDDE